MKYTDKELIFYQCLICDKVLGEGEIPEDHIKENTNHLEFLVESTLHRTYVSQLPPVSTE